jgi:putative flippase GtrA
VTAGQRWLRFSGVGALGIGVQLGTAALLVDLAGCGAEIATLLAVAVAIVHNFAWHRLWTWPDRRHTDPLLRTFVHFAAANGVVSLGGGVMLASVLTRSVHLSIVVANAVAIAGVGLINFWLADRIVFQRAESESAVHSCPFSVSRPAR